ncbi:MAG: hypothetical protein JOZ90_10680 [Alphaproteobacteria bacterium]|nr:hypothetical protein [Alphaproteobacteria bacterium]MBV9371077.1 hypothetical protein [Alphaproteobacteria bacterium]MBV9901549.1 hypothetical protein [Alphaproteobacteria bacterium]
MVRRSALLFLVALGGCAGYASDYWKPKESLVGPQLVRYGLTGDPGQCVHRKLTESLSVWQLRQLADLAGRLTPGGRNPAVLGPREFAYVAGLVEDSRVAPAVRGALDACSAAAPARVAEAPQAAPGAPPAAPAGEPLWVNLGAAQTGQGISVDATSVTRGPAWRQAWFRLLNGGTVADVGYLLRIDCQSRNIMALGGRKYSAAGALAEQKNYDKPEGPMAIEPGTVIEVAYHALCD